MTRLESMSAHIPRRASPPEPDLARTAHVDLRLDFSAQGNAAGYFMKGWSSPEAEETWSLGTSCALKLPVDDTSIDYSIVFSMRPHVEGNVLRAQRLRVLANGVEVGTFVIARRGTRACTIPAAVLGGRHTIELVFETPDAARPSGGSDGRVLAIAFSELGFYPDPFFADLSLPSTFPPEPGLSATELVQRFESLGQNCEFGLVQRRCNAEPLGLLRFASAPLPKLLAALDAGFAHMGSSESVRVELSNNGREFMVTDTTYGIVYHAWVDAGEMTAQALHKREVRRVPLLVRKLLEDLASAEKIFVFKGMGAIPEEEVYPLAVALRRYGPNTLLFVTLSNDATKVGTVEVRGPGFLVGYLDRFAPGEDAHDLSFDPWLGVCRNAFRLASGAA